MIELNDTQYNALEFIRAYRAKNGYAPSLREIGAGIGVSSATTVSTVLSKLVVTGCLLVDDGIGRSARLTEIGEQYCEGKSREDVHNN